MVENPFETEFSVERLNTRGQIKINLFPGGLFLTTKLSEKKIELDITREGSIRLAKLILAHFDTTKTMDELVNGFKQEK